MNHSMGSSSKITMISHAILQFLRHVHMHFLSFLYICWGNFPSQIPNRPCPYSCDQQHRMSGCEEGISYMQSPASHSPSHTARPTYPDMWLCQGHNTYLWFRIKFMTCPDKLFSKLIIAQVYLKLKLCQGILSFIDELEKKNHIDFSFF